MKLAFPRVVRTGDEKKDIDNLMRWADSVHQQLIRMEKVIDQTLMDFTGITSDVEVGATNAVYFGDDGTNDSWKIVRSGTELLVQRREAGSYVTKLTIQAAGGHA